MPADEPHRRSDESRALRAPGRASPAALSREPIPPQEVHCISRPAGGIRQAFSRQSRGRGRLGARASCRRIPPSVDSAREMDKEDCMKRIIVSLAVFFLASVALVGSAAAVERSYVILSRGQGAGSTAIGDVVAAAGGAVTDQFESIGIVVATSADPGFLAAVLADPRVVEAAEDVEVQWLPPNETTQAVQETETGEPGAQGVNSEPYNGYLRSEEHV